MTDVIDALDALTRGDWEAAAGLATAAAARNPGSHLAAALATFLGRLPEPGVYDEPSAFEAFIGGGGNVALYDRTIAELAGEHGRRRPASVLDIGCGDGRVAAAALGPATIRVDLVEPSADLLAAAGAAVGAAAGSGAEVAGHQVDVSTFLAGLAPGDRWDVAQSTFALHATRPEARPAILAELARRVGVLLVVDFDVPALADGSPEHLAHLADRYEQGVREYPDAPEVVTGFLLPVLVGQLGPSRPRYTFEQPTAAWLDLLEAAGFVTEARPVSPYWWADATLVVATPR